MALKFARADSLRNGVSIRFGLRQNCASDASFGAEGAAGDQPRATPWVASPVPHHAPWRGAGT